MAVRVSGHPESGNNGIFYMLTDHLGSTTMLAYGNDHPPQLKGKKVPGSEATYLPYGGYRATPTTDITDRGFTGHRHNDSIGLIYMRARYYVPGVGRFASADTIVPDQANPQSTNRYSYGRNSPLSFADPTGHCAQDDDGCWTVADHIYAWFGWRIEGIWTIDELFTILDAAYAIEDWFRGNTEGNARAHVRAYFGGTTFHHSSKFSLTNLMGSHHVEGRDVYLLNSFSRECVIHELGHVLDNVLADRFAFFGAAVWGGGPADDMARDVGQNAYCPLRFICPWYGLSDGGEDPPSNYARRGPSEDFAETFKFSVLQPGNLQNVAPRRGEWMKNFAALLVNEAPANYESPYTYNQRHYSPSVIPVPAPTPY